IVIPPAIFFYYSTLFDSRFKTLQQNQTGNITHILIYNSDVVIVRKCYNEGCIVSRIACYLRFA
ncbi:hypothetical protein P7H71_12955, partial [Lactococcus lactis]|uniref:hypothetical protein n=1 Tax=Lactococcus lactis TaxID=1358 RepID=UPI00289113CD